MKRPIKRAATATALLLPMAACGTASPTPTGRYIGPVTPTTTSEFCQPSKGVLQIRAQIVIFTPDEGTWILDGIANPDGTLTADHSRVTPSKQIYDTTLEARWTPQTITGTYKTPRCTYTVTLTRQ